MQPIFALGLMSGTSLDGIDGALIKTDGIHIHEIGPGFTIPYDKKFRKQLKEQLGNSIGSPELEEEITRRHADFVTKFRKKTKNTNIDLIGFHGQTIYHAPPKTRQLGDGKLLANLTNTSVVYDFRTQDCHQGGQGAPLVPLYHQALCRQANISIQYPAVIINIGGVANLTYVDGSPDADLIALDTGPGNALIDDFMMREMQQAYDLGGKIASFGKPKIDLLQEWLKDPYFQREFPKSLDRNYFNYLLNEIRGKNGGIDGLATLTAFTAFSIFNALQQLPQMPNQIIVCGGGRKNLTILHWLKFLCRKQQVIVCDELGWDGDLLEAQAFGFLAVRSLYGLPLSYPTTTGVSSPCLGGILVKAGEE